MTTQTRSDLDAVNDLIFGRWKSRILYTGVNLGIFDALAAGAKSSARLAEELRLDARSGYRLLRALASIGLLEEGPGEHFSLSSQGLLLCARHPGNLRAVALLQDGAEHLAIWKHLPEMVREGWQNAFRNPLPEICWCLSLNSSPIEPNHEAVILSAAPAERRTCF